MFRNVGYSCIYSLLTVLFVTPPACADVSYSLAFEAAAAFEKPRSSQPRAKISSGLLKVLTSQQPGSPGLHIGASTAVGRSTAASPLLHVRDDGRVQVYIQLYPEVDAAGFASLLYGFDLELEIVNTRHSLLQAWIAVSDLETLAGYEEVTALRPPGYAITNAGLFLTEGDSALKADQARDVFGLDGAGVTVGAISNGIESLQDAQATGDLPPDEMIIDLMAEGDGDEGTALLEIIHDIAPASILTFYGVSTSADMLDALDAMNAVGADVVIDDLIFLDEPVFEDGPIAQMVADLVADGVSYHTASGNHALGHYEGEFSGVAATLPGVGNIVVHEFAPGDIDLDIGTLAGGTSIVSVQWNDEFGTSSNDYDLLLYDSSRNNLVDFSLDIQNGDPALAPRPLELIAIFNPTQGLLVRKLVIQKLNGEVRRLEVNVFVAGAVLDHNNATGSAFGHQAVDGALSLGAINVQDPGQNDIAIYSAHGPSRLDFPSLTWRAKPDLVGVDGVEVSGVGGFGSPFFGTSAAVPHSAAVAALLLGGGVCNGHLVHECMTDSAFDLGAPGFDDVYGHGRIDALAAAEACLPATLCGDANGDCIHSASDAYIALKAGVGSAACQNCVCDVDAVNGISATDSLTILQFGVGQSVSLNCGPCS